jgi:hypothetical protein
MRLTNLKQFFETYEFSNKPIRLDKCSVITNQKEFVKSHIQVLEANSGKKLFRPYFDRLLAYYKLVIQK